MSHFVLMLACVLALFNVVGPQGQTCDGPRIASEIRGYCTSSVPSDVCCKWVEKAMHSSSCLSQVAAQPELQHVGLTEVLLGDMFQSCSVYGMTDKTSATSIPQQQLKPHAPPTQPHLSPPPPQLTPAPPTRSVTSTTSATVVEVKDTPSTDASWHHRWSKNIRDFCVDYVLAIVDVIGAIGATRFSFLYGRKLWKKYGWGRRGKEPRRGKKRGGKGILGLRQLQRSASRTSSSASSSGTDLLPIKAAIGRRSY